MARLPVRLRVAPGLEELAAAELTTRGCRVEEVPGGVLGERKDLPTFLVHSRIGAGVTLRLGRVRRDSLPDALRGMPWSQVLTGGQRIEVVARNVRARGLEKKCQAVIARNAARRGGGARLPPLRVWLIGEGEHVEVAVEAARDLWRRGWRTAPGRAPLRENLAAAVLAACGWTGDRPLVDPMCGSGTLGIEAALLGLGRPPGAHRSFAAGFWPNGTRTAIEAQQRKKPPQRSLPAIWMSDRDPRQLEHARANAARARVDRHVRIAEIPFSELDAPGTSGLLVANPPYGDRIQASEKTYRHLGGVLSDRWSGWSYGILVPDVRLARFLPGNPDTSLRFPHGGKKVWLVRGRVG